MLVVTVNYPETSTTFIDRFLASAEAYRVPAKIIFNKTDIYNEDELHYLDALVNLYESIGYPCYKISALQGEGIQQVREALQEKVTLFLRSLGCWQINPYQHHFARSRSQNRCHIFLSQKRNAHHYLFGNVSGRRQCLYH